MKKDLHITATFDQPGLLENMVEKLAIRHNEKGFVKARVPDSWQAMESSSVEAYVSGTVEFDYNDQQRIRIPFITCFVFTCTKVKNESYDFNWLISFN